MEDRSLFQNFEIKQTRQTGRFKPIKLAPQEKIEGQYWRYKKKSSPKAFRGAGRVKITRPKRTRLIDKQLISDDITNLNHLRSIKNEI